MADQPSIPPFNNGSLAPSNKKASLCLEGPSYSKGKLYQDHCFAVLSAGAIMIFGKGRFPHFKDVFNQRVIDVDIL
ncbi:hypothetical protein DCAR_0313954 [Daucus carota subsp. sativus]|uniref:Uncharacterized protein n=1 Tax=Daucus carota subsp. sativus TaxID=79200 RepID=A0A161Y306_DAUCS|nr:hypothetical protein DCAR_0313954 [Daucus carota subsp. sativus]